MPEQAQVRPGVPRAWLVSLAASLAYFGLMLVPNWRPSVMASPLFFGYFFSVLAAVALLVLTIALCALAWLWAAIRHGRPARLIRPMVGVAAIGLVTFAAVFAANRMVGRALPTGSFLAKFDSAVWRDPSSEMSADHDATRRQKMLGDLVGRVLPGRSRAEIEAMLGPSLDTPYFRDEGRDLIYATGIERDSLFAIDDEWLLIWLDDSGHFKKYRVVTD